MKLVKYEEGEIRLNSMLDEYIFGKTRYESVINQQGILFSCDSLENHIYHFSYKNFTFDEVRTYTAEDAATYVFYCAKSDDFDSTSKTLLSYFEEAGQEKSSVAQKDDMFEASFAVLCALTQAAKEGISLPDVGGGGIFIKLDGKNTKILFLPASLFKTSSAALPAIQNADNQGCWINQTLFDLPAICFQRGVIAYKMLTGRYPFPETALDRRNADIFDKNFLPAELSVNGIDSELASAINNALKLTSNAVTIPGKKQKGKSSEDLRPVSDFPLELLYKVKSEKMITKLSNEEFEQKAANYQKAQKSKVTAKRAIRRNVTKIIIFSIVAIVIAAIGINTYNTRQGDFTTTGLTSTQVIEGFFRGINTKDTMIIQGFASGKSLKHIQKTVDQIYVLDKQRKAYNGDNGYASPENWVLYLTDESKLSRSGLYGASQLLIDGKPGNIAIELKTKKEKPEALTVEKNVTLTNGLKSVHQVEYFVLHTEGEDNMVYVDYCTDVFTLTYKKDHWIITDISQNPENIKINNAQFVSDYFELLRINNFDTVRTVQMLGGKYPWLPEAYLVKHEKERLEEENRKFLETFSVQF